MEFFFFRKWLELCNDLQTIFGNVHKFVKTTVIDGKCLYLYQVSEGSSSDIGLLLEREKNYKQAIENANKAGEGSKARRYGRGLKVWWSLQFAATSFLPIALI